MDKIVMLDFIEGGRTEQKVIVGEKIRHKKGGLGSNHYYIYDTEVQGQGYCYLNIYAIEIDSMVYVSSSEFIDNSLT